MKRVYHLRDGRLILEADFFDAQGWPPGEAKALHPDLARLL